MFSPDREPHPAVAEIKYLQQPVLFVPLQADSDAGKKLCVSVKNKQASIGLEAVNRYTFRDLSHLTWSWQLVSNRNTKPIRKGTFVLSADKEKEIAIINIENAISRVIQLEKTKPPGGNSFFLNLRGCLTTATPWANAGHVIVTQQFSLSFVFEEMDDVTPKPIKLSEQAVRTLSADSTNESVTIFWKIANAEKTPLATFDINTGALDSYLPQGENVLVKPLTPNFTRAATDNDRGGMELVLDFMFPFACVKELYQMLLGTNEFSHLSNWSSVGVSQAVPPIIRCSKLTVAEKVEGMEFVVTSDCEVVRNGSASVLMDVTLVYTVYNNGMMKVSQKVTPTSMLKRLPSLPRVGVCMQLRPDLFNISYYGRGPGENYPDRKTGSEMGLYETTPGQMGYLKYVVPSENGCRSDCEWVSFRSMNQDSGVLVVADRNSFHCSALLHSAADLDRAEHTYDLTSSRDGTAQIHVSIDHKIMGVAGDVSWYPCVYPEFMIPPSTSYEYIFHLSPLGKSDDAAIIARTVQHT